MEREPDYTVEITPEAEGYYYDILDYLYKHHSEESADRKSKALLDMAVALESNPFIGRKEDNLEFLECEHRYILYNYTKIKAIKIIYFIDEKNKTVYITDFFPCESDENRISSR